MSQDKNSPSPIEGRLLQALTAENNQLIARLSESTKSRNRALMLAVISVGGFVAVVTIGLVAFPRVKHVAVDSTDRVCPLQSTTDSQTSIPLVTEFAKNCVIEMDTFGFHDYRLRINSAVDKCLTPDFRRAYLSDPVITGRIQTVRDGVLVVNANSLENPVVSTQGKTPTGESSWEVQVPIRRAYRQGDKSTGRQDVLYKVTVVNTGRSAYSPLGLSISNLNEKPYIEKTR